MVKTDGTKKERYEFGPKEWIGICFLLGALFTAWGDMKNSHTAAVAKLDMLIQSFTRMEDEVKTLRDRVGRLERQR